MGTAYTPGLKVSSGTLIRKERRLPLKGEVVVNVGDAVDADTVVARTDIPGVMQTVRVAETLGLQPQEALQALQVEKGDTVDRGQVIAKSKSFFGLLKSECKSPHPGTVELVSHAVGHVGIRLPSTPVEVTAYIDGKVTQIMENEGVVVETHGALVQGIFGVGGERAGDLSVCVDSPDDVLSADSITGDHAGCVVVGGSMVELAALRKAAELGVKGVVAGGIIDTDLIDYVGHDIGVAITGQEDVNTTLILTEGFGVIPMAQRTFDLLKSLDGQRVSVNGATQIRAGVIRPEIICPQERLEKPPDDAEGQILEIGSNIRIIREPHFGALGTVTALPPAPVEIKSGATVRILEAKLADGANVSVPRANVEILES